MTQREAGGVEVGDFIDRLITMKQQLQKGLQSWPVFSLF
jgi:hypothetical protein